MSQRMIDLMYRDGFLFEGKRTYPHALYGEAVSSPASNLPFAEVVICDNVTKYMYEGTDQEIWTPDHFPNVAPPFPVTWYETRCPTRIQSEVHGTVPWTGPYAWGVLVKAVPASLGLPVFSRLLDKTKQQSGFPVEEFDLSQIHWIYVVDMFFHNDRNGSVLGPVAIGFLGVKEQGQLFTQKTSQGKIYPDFWLPAQKDLPQDLIDRLALFCQTNMFTFFLTISFLHCKNTTVLQVDPCHPRGKKRQTDPCRRLHYKVLDIEPMKKILKHTGDVHGTRLPQSLHICRGHFKNYSEGSGLFGKYHGTYWWESRVRGTEKVGILNKDYHVKV